VDKIRISGQDVRLMLDSRFYDSNAVLMAAKAFTESCWVYLDGDQDDKIFISLKPKSREVALEEVGYEFFNYVLGLMKNE